MRRIHLVIALLLLSAGCTRHRTVVVPDPGTPAATAAADWQHLGTRTVQGGADRDVIHVTLSEGRFRRIRFDVSGSALEMFNIVITFANDETFSPDTRLVFGRRGDSRTIDLPGGARVIRKIAFRYGNLPRGGRARVSAFGK